MKLDALIFGAHPDDAELSIGGTIAKMTKAGLLIGVVDMTQGEMGTRGTIETRYAEAEAATKILNLTLRENLSLPDGKLKQNDEFVKKIVEKIRQYQPNVIFAPYFVDRHPDHEGAGRIVKEAMFCSGLTKYITSIDGKEQAAYRPKKLYYFMQTYEFKPTMIIDISETFQTKMEAVKAYGTQFYNPDSTEPETFISQKNFLEYLAARARTHGFSIQKEYGEPLLCEENIEFDLVHQLKELQK